MKKLLLGITCVIGMALQAGAIFLDNANTDARYIGFIDDGIGGDAVREGYLNILLDQAVNTGPVTIGTETYTRSGLSTAGFADAVHAANGGNSGSYVLPAGGYQYLYAKYDGPNYGVEVWYIGGLTGTIEISLKEGPGEGYGLSGVSFFNGGTTPPPPGVPDGGSTMLLLGSALAGIGLIRRKLS